MKLGRLKIMGDVVVYSTVVGIFGCQLVVSVSLPLDWSPVLGWNLKSMPGASPPGSLRGGKSHCEYRTNKVINTWPWWKPWSQATDMVVLEKEGGDSDKRSKCHGDVKFWRWFRTTCSLETSQQGLQQMEIL